MGGLTIENNFFVLKIEKRNKIIVFDWYFLQLMPNYRIADNKWNIINRINI